MAIDDLLDIMIPVDCGLNGKSVAARRGVKVMMLVLIAAVIVGSAIAVTSDVCPEDAAVWYVWVMAVWRVFLHAVIYCLAVGAWRAFDGKDMAKGGERPADAAPVLQASDEDTSMEEDILFSSDVDEEAVISYIKSNPDRFSSGEDMSLLFLAMSDRSYICTSKKKFHEFLSSLIDCAGYDTFSGRCRRVKEILEYTDTDSARRKLMVKYDGMQKLLQEFTIRYT